MPVITGTPDNDMLSGTDEADIITGLGGSDLLFGAGGDDEMDGGEGADFLSGGLGNDRMYGGAGNDSFIESEGASDQLYGGDGDDRIFYASGNFAIPADALIDGGAGDDSISFGIGARPSPDKGTLIGGTGHDRIDSVGGDHISIDAGADADWVQITNFQTDYDIALGSGSDLLVMLSNQFFPSENTSIVVSDFATGDSGDVLNLTWYLSRQVSFNSWNFADNPFATGHLQVIQRGADAVVQIDADAGGLAYGFSDVIVLSNVTASTLTARNLGGYAASGAATLGTTIDGSAVTDFLGGTSGNDLIRGLGGDDGIYGGAGNDRLEGGAGDDTLEGELGDDELHGGDGNDTLNEVLAGSDQLYGEEGNDSLFVDRQWFNVASTSVLMDGGNGADRLSYLGRLQADDVVMNGGSGNDYLSIYLARNATMDAGDGDDTLLFDIGIANLTVTLGAGADMIQPSTYSAPVVGFTVLDFATGDSGDRFDLPPLLSRLLSGWDSGTNPFTTNFLRIAQSGADTLLQFNAGGTGDSWQMLARLAHLDASALTPFNLGFAPGQISYLGTAGADTLAGSAAGDQLIGLAGNDIYYVDNAGDVVREKAGEGTDIVYASVGYTLNAGAHVELLSTGSIAGIQNVDMTGNELSNTIWGNYGNNTLSGGVGGNDTLVGFIGDDIYLINNGNEVVVENQGEGTDIVYVNASYTLSNAASIELLSTYSIAGTQAIDLTGNELDNTIWGNRGNNTLSGGFGGHDTLVGFLGNDIYLINNGDENVVENAGEGTDIVYVNASYTLSANASIELLSTYSIAGTAAINLTGNNLSNTIWGNRGDNTLSGGIGGNDTLVGFLGNDTYLVNNGNEYISENAGEGTDIVFANVSYVLTAGASIELLSTNSIGGLNALDLTGNELVNTLWGNGGANVLNGGAGSDTLSGFGGADTFAFTTALGASNVDAITDFAAGTDKIALDDAIFTGLGLGALNAGAFVIGATALDADDRILYDSASGNLYFDADGNGAGAAVLFANLSNHAAIGASDFQVI